VFDLSAVGPLFGNAQNPQPMARDGNHGDVGVARISEMLFTVADILPGCILLEVNMLAQNPSDVRMWNTQFRVSSAAGSTVETA
jgi:glucan 1,3-beta-glucosidase